MNYEPTYRRWTNDTSYPTGPTSATIYFHGFLCLSFNDKCELGVNREAKSHELNVQVRARDNCPDQLLTLPPDFATARPPVSTPYKLHIRVDKPVVDGVFVLDPRKNRKDPVDGRHSYTYYGFDLEGPEMHNRRLRKNPDVLWPRFTIDNGLFYTYKVSESQFALMKPDGTEGEKRRIGLVLAVDIYLNTGGSIGFYINDETSPRLELREASEKKYEIAITNSCGTTGVPTARTDFYMNYEAIDKTDVKPTDIFNLDLKEDSRNREPVLFGPCKMGDVDFSDPAPCLPVTFGQSVNLD